ncbi:MAG: TCP-1/cpn60 chaperonin family protein [Candidatus Thermoplasmatota archaeon]
MPRTTYVEGVREAASWVADFLSPAYGPGGGFKLAAEEGALFSSGASALRESGLRSPELSPYVGLATAVQGQVGDHATGATLLAARLVLAGLRLEENGVGRASTMDGLRLARRQALALLGSLERPDSIGVALATVGRTSAWASIAWNNLPVLAADGVVRLDDVDIIASPAASTASWLPGLVVALESPRRAGTVRVAILDQPLRTKPRSDLMLHVRDPTVLTPFHEAEERRLRQQAKRLEDLGVGLVAAPGIIPEPIQSHLAALGIQTVANVPLSALRRIARCTGAEAAPTLDAIVSGQLGEATIRRDGKRWLLFGRGPTATFEIPAATAAHVADANDQAERLVRAAGRHSTNPRSLPGGGRWQREVASALRRSADAAPGRSPLVLRAVADAFASLVDDLVRNLGRDPWRESLHPNAEATFDVAAAVRVAVEGAFEAATQILRVDARHARRSSSTVGLRGAGQPTKIRSGDVPPLM